MANWIKIKQQRINLDKYSKVTECKMSGEHGINFSGDNPFHLLFKDSEERDQELNKIDVVLFKKNENSVVVAGEFDLLYAGVGK